MSPILVMTKKRIEQDKGGLLQDSYQWILDNQEFHKWRYDPQSRMLWVKGDPGKGKTMLLCGIIDELEKPGLHSNKVSFFFCQKSDDRINSATRVLRGLIFLLIEQQPSLISLVRQRYDQAGRSLFEDVNAWTAVSGIFADIAQNLSAKNIILVIDALDECVEDNSLLLDLIIKESSKPSQVKWIVSSRNWPAIEQKMNHAQRETTLSLELNAQSISKAVGKYIEIKVQGLAEGKGYDTKTQNLVREHLIANADSTFLWVWLACDFLAKNYKSQVRACLKKFPPGLEDFYESMIQHVSSSRDEGVDFLKQILALVTITFRPIALAEMPSLIEITEDVLSDVESLQEMVGRCGSFLTLRDGVIYFVHQSAKDFLLRKLDYLGISPDASEMHYSIFKKSLQVMLTILRRDMYGLTAPGASVSDVQIPESDPLVCIKYSCVYWIEHLGQWHSCQSTANTRENEYVDLIDYFLRDRFLYWLEALSLLGTMSEGVRSLLRLEDLLQV